MSTFYCRECNTSYMGQTHECETIERYREMNPFEWECATCGEVFDKRKTSPLQHICPVASESAKFLSSFNKFLSSPEGQFAIYLAQRLINASNPTNLPLAES